MARGLALSMMRTIVALSIHVNVHPHQYPILIFGSEFDENHTKGAVRLNILGLKQSEATFFSGHVFFHFWPISVMPI